LPSAGSRRATVLAVARRPAAAGRARAADPPCWRWHAGPRLPGEGGPLIHVSVYEPVDDLCKKAARLCAAEEMLGIAAAPRWLGKSFTCANTIHTLCMKESAELSTCRTVGRDK
jgi:hypothetical protein